MKSERKKIGGVWHVKKQCYNCKEFVWREENLPEKDNNFFCDTCYKSKSEMSKGTGGGERIIRSSRNLS